MTVAAHNAHKNNPERNETAMLRLLNHQNNLPHMITRFHARMGF